MAIGGLHNPDDDFFGDSYGKTDKELYAEAVAKHSNMVSNVGASPNSSASLTNNVRSDNISLVNSNTYGNVPRNQTGVDTARVSAAALTTTASTAATLATTAGSVAAIPVGGWIAAGVLGAAAGITALVAAIKGGKIRKAQAIAYAKKLKIPEPERFPEFTVKALRLSDKRRKRLIILISKRINRKKDKKGLFPKRHDAKLKKDIFKLRLLKAIENVNRRKLRPDVQKSIDMSPPVNPEVRELPDTESTKKIQSSLEKSVDDGSGNTNVYIALGVAALLAAGFVVYKINSGEDKKKKDKDTDKDKSKKVGA